MTWSPIPVPRLAGLRQQRIGVMFLEPFVDVVEEMLLAPQHPTQRLPHHIGCVLAYTGWRYRPIELVGLAPARLHDLIKFLAKGVPRYRVAQP